MATDPHDDTYQQADARTLTRARARAKAYATALAAAIIVTFACDLLYGLRGGWVFWILCMMWFGGGFAVIAENQLHNRR